MRSGSDVEDDQCTDRKKPICMVKGMHQTLFLKRKKLVECSFVE